MRNIRFWSIVLCIATLLSSVAMLASCEDDEWENPRRKKNTQKETESETSSGQNWWEYITLEPEPLTETNIEICTEPYWGTETIGCETTPVYEEHESFEQAQMDFAVELFKKSIAQRETDGSSLISPLSVMLALSVTANGAAEQTRKDMESVLGGLSVDELNECLSSYVSALPNNDKYKLLIANSIWMKDDGKLQINEEFLERVWAYYNSVPYTEPFDSETLAKINEWVSANTDGMIENMLDEISNEAVMYLINAICFDAQWSSTYSDYNVKEGYFTDVNGDVKKAEVLFSVEGRYLEDNNAIGFMKPYAGGYTFVALLPKDGVSIYDYIASLNSDSLMSMLREPRYLDVYATLPKFSYEYSMSLNDVLSSMGMESAFVGNSPDFTKMGTHADGPLAISNVLHKTFIEVTQYGTRAGASTVVEMSPECAEPMPMETKNVVLDRPFVYLIVENNTKLPVFMGAVTEMDQSETVGFRKYVVPTREEYVRIDGCGDLENMLSPVINEAGYIQIDSTDELDALSNVLKSNDEYFMLDSSDGSFIDMYAGLNGRFFEENSLIFVYVSEGSGSIRHRIDACYIDESEDPSALVIELCRLQPYCGTDDMAGWLIGVGIPKNNPDFSYVRLSHSSELADGYELYE